MSGEKCELHRGRGSKTKAQIIYNLLKLMNTN